MQIDYGERHELADGDSVTLRRPADPWTLCVHPASGASIDVDISATPTNMADADVKWVDLQTGITQATAITYPGPVTEIRVTTTGGGATVDFVDSVGTL